MQAKHNFTLMKGQEDEQAGRLPYLCQSKYISTYKRPYRSFQLVLCRIFYNVEVRGGRFPANALIDYYSETNTSVANRIRSALNFFQEKKQWSYLICPVVQCSLYTNHTIFLAHLCNKHKNIPFYKLQHFSVLENQASSGHMFVKKSYSYKLIDVQEYSVKNLELWYHGGRKDMFKSHPP